MVKTLKLCMMYVAFTALLCGVFLFVRPSGLSGGLDSTTSSNVEEMSTRIRSDWAYLSDFDTEIYNRHFAAINQRKANGILSDNEYLVLIEALNTSAVNVAVKAMNREFSRADCNPEKLRINHDGINEIAARSPEIRSLTDVDEVTNVYKLYNDIIAFNSQTINQNPQFSINNLSWTPDFEVIRHSILARYNDFISNPRYLTRLRHINDVMPIEHTENWLAEASNNFYITLASRIIDEFSTRFNSNPSEENRSRLYADFRMLTERLMQTLGPNHRAVRMMNEAAGTF